MRVARGSASWVSSHGRGLGPRDVLMQCGRPGFSPWVGKIPWQRILTFKWVGRGTGACKGEGEGAKSERVESRAPQVEEWSRDL